MGVFEDVQKFLKAHRACGEVTGGAQPPTREGYRLRLTCPCGAEFDRYVTPEVARYDLIHSSLLAIPN